MQHISDRAISVSSSFSSESELLSVVLEDCQVARMTAVELTAYAATLTWEDGDVLVNTGSIHSMERE